MKILNIQYGNLENPYARGGLPNSLHNSFKILSDKHEITFLTGLWPNKPAISITDGITYIQNGLCVNKYLNRLTFSIKSSLYKRINQYDLIVITWDRYAPIILPKKLPCPVILELHAEYFNFPSKCRLIEPYSKFMLRQLLKKTNYIISVSHGVHHIASKFTKTLKLSLILPSGTHEQLLTNKYDNNEERYLLYLGRLDLKSKGIDLLLKSYHAANLTTPLFIVGDGPDKRKIENLITALNLTKKISLLGWVKGAKKYQLIANCIAVCVPSKVEGWATVAIEAAALGKPVIGTDVVGLNETIINNKTGILVKKESIITYACSLKKIIKDRNLRRFLGDNAKKRARNYTWETLAKKRDQFLHEVLKDYSNNVN
ncbi:glycosyltransferase family 4 protein [Chlamydiota bacterium]